MKKRFLITALFIVLAAIFACGCTKEPDKKVIAEYDGISFFSSVSVYSPIPYSKLTLYDNGTATYIDASVYKSVSPTNDNLSELYKIGVYHDFVCFNETIYEGTYTKVADGKIILNVDTFGETLNYSAPNEKTIKKYKDYLLKSQSQYPILPPMSLWGFDREVLKQGYTLKMNFPPALSPSVLEFETDAKCKKIISVKSPKQKSIKKYEYHENGVIQTIAEYELTGENVETLVERKTFSDNGDMLEYIPRFGNTTYVYEHQREYYDSGKIKSYYLVQNNKVTHKYEYYESGAYKFYSIDSDYDSETTFFEDGVIDTKISYGRNPAKTIETYEKNADNMLKSYKKITYATLNTAPTEIIYYYRYEYHNNGKLKTQTKYTENDQFTETKEYDKNGNLIKTSSINNSPDYTSRSIKEYYENGLVKSEYYSQGDDSYTYTEYDKYGYVTSRESSSSPSSGSTYSEETDPLTGKKTITYYNLSGEINSITILYPDGSTDIHKYSYFNNEPNQSYGLMYVFEYHKDRKWKKFTTYSADGSSVVIKFEHDGMTILGKVSAVPPSAEE